MRNNSETAKELRPLQFDCFLINIFLSLFFKRLGVFYSILAVARTVFGQIGASFNTKYVHVYNTLVDPHAQTPVVT